VTRPALLAVDGGGSKIDAALVGRGGEVLSAARVGNRDASHREVYLDAIGRAVTSIAEKAGLEPSDGPIAPLGVYCLAGADFPADERRMLGWLREAGWTAENVLRNDTFAIMRAGSDRPWGVGVVCGTGTNCAAVSPDGRTFRLPAIGHISGDWGGASDLGGDALWYAVRAEDGRGPRTELARLVPAHFGLRRPKQVTEAIHLGRLGHARRFSPGTTRAWPDGDEMRLSELAPVVFKAAGDGDPIARSLVDRQADEIVTMATAAIRKLGMEDLDVHVALGGGVFRNRFAPFPERIRSGVRAVAPRARVSVLSDPPIVGAALLGLDRLGAPRPAERRLRATLTHQRLRTQTRARR
jgi:N-acetylglucosamine kinase-like BadF-type ATPase